MAQSTKASEGRGSFGRPYFGGRILNLLPMITGEREGRSGKSVGVSELRRCACCRPSRPPARPPACLCSFRICVLQATRGWGKKTPWGSRQEVPAPRIKVCSGSYCDVRPARPAPSTGFSSLSYIPFDSLVVSRAHTAQRFELNVQKNLQRC